MKPKKLIAAIVSGYFASAIAQKLGIEQPGAATFAFALALLIGFPLMSVADWSEGR
jgi:hypothetical protein